MSNEKKHAGIPEACPDCRIHSGIVSDIKTAKASIACIKEARTRDHQSFWQTIRDHQNEMRADMKTKVSLKIFIASFTLIVTLGIVIFGFQWSAISEAETLDRQYQEKMSDKVQQIQQDISVIKALTLESNGG